MIERIDSGPGRHTPLTGINIPMQPIQLPQSSIDNAIRLMGFDFRGDLFHVLAFDFGDDGGAIGIWREGDEFCARISLEALAVFWLTAKESANAGSAS